MLSDNTKLSLITALLPENFAKYEGIIHNKIPKDSFKTFIK
jgi:hypothetical protein